MKQFFKSEFWKRFGTGILLCVVAAIGAVAVLILHQYWLNEISDLMNAQVAAANEQAIETSQSERQEAEKLSQEAEEVRQELFGMETSRKETDDAIMSEIMSYVTTWSSSETYTESRDALIEAYPWIENTSFMTMFFPSAENVILQDSEGNDIVNYLDDGRNITFVSMESHVVAIDGGTYSYVAEVVTQSSGTTGGSSDGLIFITYDMTEDGQAENLNAYTVSR